MAARILCPAGLGTPRPRCRVDIFKTRQLSPSTGAKAFFTAGISWPPAIETMMSQGCDVPTETGTFGPVTTCSSLAIAKYRPEKGSETGVWRHPGDSSWLYPVAPMGIVPYSPNLKVIDPVLGPPRSKNRSKIESVFLSQNRNPSKATQRGGGD